MFEINRWSIIRESIKEFRERRIKYIIWIPIFSTKFIHAVQRLLQIYTEIYPFALGTWITPCINVGGGCNVARCLVQPQKHLITVSLIELTDLSTPSSLTPIMPSGWLPSCAASDAKNRPGRRVRIKCRQPLHYAYFVTHSNNV